MSHWDNDITAALAGALEQRGDEESAEAAEWLAEHENDDEVWGLIGAVLDAITRAANGCTQATGHLPGSDHRSQECPTYHDDEGASA